MGEQTVKVRYVGDDYHPRDLIKGSVYEVAQIEGGWYRIVDETDEDYLYHPAQFEVVEAEPAPPTFAADDSRVAIY